MSNENKTKQPIMRSVYGWFRLKKSTPVIHIPEIGRIYRFKDGDDPWSRLRTHGVEVIDVKEGWVRYKFLGGSIFNDERMELSSFNHCYPTELNPKPNHPKK
jgi:hypothetical protein